MAVSVLWNERIEILDYLKKSVIRIHALAAAEPGKFGDEIMQVADQVEGDAAKLEAELIAAGYIQKPG